MENGHVNGMMDAPKTNIKIQIGATEYEPRWSFLAEYLLSQRGLTLNDVLAEMNGSGKKAAAYAMELVAACIAHHFPNGAAPDAQTLAAQVGPAQFVPMWQGLLKAGEAAGAIKLTPKNAPAPDPKPAQPILMEQRERKDAIDDYSDVETLAPLKQ
jgi:hypothetical protein